MSPKANDMMNDDDIFELTDVVDKSDASGGDDFDMDEGDVDVSFEQELEDLFSDDDDLFSGSDDTEMSATLEYNEAAAPMSAAGGISDDLGLDDDDDDGGGIDFEATMAMDDIDFSDLGGGLGDDDMDFDTALKSVEGGGQPPVATEVDDDFSLELDDDDDDVMDLGEFEAGSGGGAVDDEPIDLGDFDLGDDDGGLDTMELGSDDAGDLEFGGLELGDDEDAGIELNLDSDLTVEESGSGGLGGLVDDLGDDLGVDFDSDLTIEEDLPAGDTLPDAGRQARGGAEDIEIADLGDLGDLDDLTDDGGLDMSLDDDLDLGGEISLTETLAPVDDIPLSDEEEAMLASDGLSDETIEEMVIDDLPGKGGDEDDLAIALDESMIVDEDDDDTFDMDDSIPLDETISLESPATPKAPEPDDDLDDLDDLPGLGEMDQTHDAVDMSAMDDLDIDLDGDLDLGGLEDIDKDLAVDGLSDDDDGIDLGADVVDPLADTLIDEDGITPQRSEENVRAASGQGIDMSAFAERLKGLDALARERFESIEQRINEYGAELESTREEVEQLKGVASSAPAEDTVSRIDSLGVQIKDLLARVEAMGDGGAADLAGAVDEARKKAEAAETAAMNATRAVESVWDEKSSKVSSFKQSIMGEVAGIIAGEITELEGKMSDTPDFSKLPDVIWQKLADELERRLNEMVTGAVKAQMDKMSEEVRQSMHNALDQGMEGRLESSASAAAARVVREELENLARELEMLGG